MAQFNKEEINKIAVSAVMAGFAVAKADRDAGETSLAAAIAEKKDLGSTPSVIKEVYNEKYSGNQLIREVISHLSFLYEDTKEVSDAEKEFYVALHAKNDDWQSKFRDTKELLSSRISSSEANDFKQFLISISKRIANQSGAGDMGLQGEKSSHEKRRINEIANLLGV